MAPIAVYVLLLLAVFEGTCNSFSPEDKAILSFDNSIYNVSESEKQLKVMLTLSQPLTIEVILKIERIPQNGDIKRAQFESNVTFNTGCINATLNIDITDDACCKENDNFRLKIDDQHLTDSYYELIDVSTTDNFFTEVIIWDDDCNAYIGFTESSYRVSESEGQLTVPVNLNDSINCDFEITISSAFNDSLGNSSSDIPNSWNLKFVNGSTVEYLNINITDNIICEADKKFELFIDNISDAHCFVFTDFERKYASVTIEDDDCANVDFDQSSYRINEDAGSVELALVLSRPMSCNCYVALTVSTTDMTATRDEDYGPGTDARVIFRSGITRAKFEIPIINDDDYEDSETFQATVNPLSLPYGIAIGSTSRAEVTILDNDKATVRFKEADCVVDEDTGSVKHTLVLDKPLSANVSIRVDTVDQTTSSYDYEAGPFFIPIPAGEVEVSFNVSINDDDTYESDESFELVISRTGQPPRIRHVQDYTSTVIIDDNERLISVSFNESTFVYEHRGPIKPMLVLDKPSPCCLSVPIEVMSGTATGHDYDLGRNVLNITFPAGTTCAPFDIPIVDDILSEANETFTISIINSSLPFGLKLEGPDNAVLTIVDNDYYVGFSQPIYTVYEDEGPVEIVVEIKSYKTALTDIVMQVRDMSNTAENGSDYDAGPGLFNVTIKKGENSAIFYINITDDEVYENGDDNHGEDFSLDIIASSLEPVGSIHLGHTSKTRVIILDDEYTLSFGNNIYVFEEDSDEALFDISVSRPFRNNTEVEILYIDFTATGSHNTNDTNEIDYFADYLSDGLIFPAGIRTLANLTLNIVNDKRLESNELFRIVAVPPELPINLTYAAAEVIIRDDDDFEVTFETDHYIIDKNQVDASIKLLLRYPVYYGELVMFPVNVTIDEENGNATGTYAQDEGITDYIFQNYSLSYKQNESVKELVISVVDDNIVEPDETFFLNIVANSIITGFSPGRPNSDVIIGDYGRLMITILNDDVCKLKITDDGELSFTRPLSEGVTVNVTYNDNTQQVSEITAKETEGKYPLGMTKDRINSIEVIVPKYFNQDSIVSEDSKDLITVSFSK